MRSGVRLALIGGGDHGLRALGAAVSRLPGWSIVAVADPDAGARERAAAVLPQARLHADHQALLAEAEAEAVDLIVIATPPAVTVRVAGAAMMTGAAILIEKPGAASASALAALPLARTHPVTCAYSYRFHPTVIAYRAALPDIGPLQRLELCFNAPMDARGTWRASRATGGGALRDLGTHLLDFARQVLTAPLTLEGATIRSIRTGDDEVSLEFTAGETTLGVRCAYHGAPEFSLLAVGRDGRLRANLWSMTTPARGWFDSLSSKLLTRMPGPRRPATALLQSRMDTLVAAMAPTAENPPASVADAAAILRIVEDAESHARS